MPPFTFSPQLSTLVTLTEQITICEMRKYVSVFILLITAILIQACEPQTKRGSGAGRFGMMDENTPEYAAIKFFDHLYHDKNLNGVFQFSTERLERLLKSYHTNRNVQRHVVNLSYDKVEIKHDSGNSIGRSEFAEDAVVTLFFTGTHNGDKKEDIRVVDMVKIDGKWKVTKIRADKFL